RWKSASGIRAIWPKAARRPSPFRSRVPITLSVHHTPGCMGKSLWRNKLQGWLVRCRASLNALRTVGRAHAVPTVPGARATHQPLVHSAILLLLVVAAYCPQLAERAAAAAEHLSPAEGALQVLLTTSELLVGQNRLAFGLLQH